MDEKIEKLERLIERQALISQENVEALNGRMNKLEKIIEQQTINLKQHNALNNQINSNVQNIDNTQYTEPATTLEKLANQNQVNTQNLAENEDRTIQQNIQNTLNQKQSDSVAKTNIEDDWVKENPNVSAHFNTETGPDPVSKFFTWLAKDWPMKMGAFLVISAIGWLVSYAFINDWIAPEGRVFSGIAFGIILLVVGTLRSFKQQLQGNVLMLIGGISILVAAISGVVMYDMFPEIVVLGVSLLISGFLAMMAMKQKNLTLGAATYAMGALVPMFVVWDIEIEILFLYLFVLTLGTLWTVYKTQWRALTILSLLVVAFYSLVYGAFDGFDRNVSNLIFAFMFIIVFYLANVGALISAKKVIVTDLFVSAGVGLLFLMWMMMVAPEDLVSLFILIGVFIFAIGSFILFQFSSMRHPVIMYSVVSLSLLAAATAIELDGWVLTIALTTEFTLMIILWLSLTASEKMSPINFSSVVIFGIPVLLSFVSVIELFEYLDGYGSRYNSNLPYENLFVIFYICLAAFLIAISILYFAVRKGKEIMGNQQGLMRIFLAIGGSYAIMFTWLLLHLLLDDFSIATMMYLIIYTVVGLFFYIKGCTDDNTAFKVVGSLLFAIVLGRIFFIEFWDMVMVQRITTLFVVGGLLVSTVFFGKKNKS